VIAVRKWSPAPKNARSGFYGIRLDVSILKKGRDWHYGNGYFGRQEHTIGG